LSQKGLPFLDQAFSSFLAFKPPEELTVKDLQDFLSHLAVEKRVSLYAKSGLECLGLLLQESFRAGARRDNRRDKGQRKMTLQITPRRGWGPLGRLRGSL